MSGAEKEKLKAAHARASEAFNALPREQKIARLKQYGILDSRGRLAPRYRTSGSSKKVASR